MHHRIKSTGRSLHSIIEVTRAAFEPERLDKAKGIADLRRPTRRQAAQHRDRGRSRRGRPAAPGWSRCSGPGVVSRPVGLRLPGLVHRSPTGTPASPGSRQTRHQSRDSAEGIHDECHGVQNEQVDRRGLEHDAGGYSLPDPSTVCSVSRTSSRSAVWWTSSSLNWPAGINATRASRSSASRSERSRLHPLDRHRRPYQPAITCGERTARHTWFMTNMTLII